MPAAAEEKWGPFRGKIVDMETGQGIPGAVVLAIWLEKVPTPIEMHTRFYDAREVVSGPDGSFEILVERPPSSPPGSSSPGSKCSPLATPKSDG
jgi:hypothetical protein